LYGLEFTTSESQIGFLASAIALAALCMRPFAALISDRYDNSRIIMLAQLGTAVVVALYIIAPNIGSLIVMRLVQGLLFGLGTTVIVTAAARIIPGEIMGRGIGILTVTGMGSQAIAPIIGLSIVEHYNYTVLFAFTSVIALAASMIALVTKVGKSTPVKLEAGSRGFSFKDLFAVEAMGLVLLTVLIALSTSLPASFIVLHAHSIGIQNIGLYFTINTVALILMRTVGSGLIDRYSYRQILPVCAAMSAAGLAIIGSSTSFAPLAVAAVLMGLSYGISMPTLLTSMIRFVAPERLGTASATYYFGVDFAYIAGPVAMGFIAEATRYSTGFFVFIAPTLLVIPMTFIIWRKLNTDILSK